MLSILLASLLVTAPDIGLKLEGGFAVPLNEPQITLFDVGAGLDAHLMISLTKFLDISPTFNFVYLPKAVNQQEGSAWELGGGLRLHRPHDATTHGGVSPWLDSDILFARTGSLNMFAWDVGAGLALPLDELHRFYVGPYVRFNQLTHSNNPSFNNSDVNMFVAGISVEFGSPGIKRLPAPQVVYVERTITKEIVAYEVCPPASLPASVPARKKLVLLNKVYFATDKDVILDKSQPALNEVLTAINDPENIVDVLEVEGHTDSTGSEAHNLDLSSRRAKSVAQWLTDHGSKVVIVTQGFGSTKPIASNKTRDGRATNRRVEFYVNP